MSIRWKLDTCECVFLYSGQENKVEEFIGAENICARHGGDVVPRARQGSRVIQQPVMLSNRLVGASLRRIAVDASVQAHYENVYRNQVRGALASLMPELATVKSLVALDEAPETDLSLVSAEYDKSGTLVVRSKVLSAAQRTQLAQSIEQFATLKARAIMKGKRTPPVVVKSA